MMHMWYWFGTDLGAFLFQGYTVKTVLGLLATCLGLAALAIVYEGMKVLQFKLRRISQDSLPSDNSASSENSSLLSRISATRLFVRPNGPICGYNARGWSRWLIEVMHWSLHTTLGYILMLAVMTCNGYVSIALALGGGIGYWIFGPALMELNMARFNDNRKNIQCDPECSDAIASPERCQSTVSVVAERLAADASVDVHV